MNFEQLEQRFLDTIREKVRSGELTERSLARITGISQPHIHNVLKGRRTFSHQMADTVLRRLKLDILDLITVDELLERHRRP